jgi:predicted transcriptional regulator
LYHANGKQTISVGGVFIMMWINLKEARLKSGYTIKQVAAMVKLSQKALSKYEMTPGKTPVDVYVKLLSIYKFSL